MRRTRVRAEENEAAGELTPGELAAPARPAPETARSHLEHAGNRALGNLLQAKLAVGPADDAFEREADRIAALMDGVRAGPAVPETVARKPAGAAGERSVDGALEQRIAGAGGSGVPVEPTVRTRIEQLLGADLGAVRVHDSPAAAELNADLHARAFTLGSDVFFGAGQYQPGTASGQRLLAHELTHVVQQGAAVRRDVVQRAPATLPEIEVSLSKAEREKTLTEAGWRQVDVILTITNFENVPLHNYLALLEFKAPGVVPQVHGATVEAGTAMWSDVWLQPDGAVRVLAASLGAAALAPQGVQHYTLPEKGPLRLQASQIPREESVTAATSEQAAVKVGAKGTAGVDFKVVKIGSEVSGEVSKGTSDSLSRTWKVILPSGSLSVTQVTGSAR